MRLSQAVCSFECAELLVPFADDCVKMMEGMPPANFPFTVPQLITFSASCRQTTELHHYSDGATCSESEEELEERVLDVNTVCCTQDGEFSCGSTDGEFDDVPWGCKSRAAPLPRRWLPPVLIVCMMHVWQATHAARSPSSRSMTSASRA